ncbi:DUF1876 domain-containing protein [Streptomyces sp. NPDC005799]|uniref:DUF1876 domain-containing protein n=1 Tax=Streptomyces sp. NPDC005799 TaxID=3154678 RepID=UPI0033CA1B1A
MSHTAEWKVRLYLFEEERMTKARVVLDTGTTSLTGHGTAHCSPGDTDVPEIGDELAAGRALHDLARQLVDTAERDIGAVDASTGGRESASAIAWPM